MNSTAPFFCDYVLAYLLQDPQLGATVQERKNVLKNGGLTIKTTLDPYAQGSADNAVAAHVNPTDAAIGALAIEQPGTGNVLALAQSRPMGNRKKLGETYINFTVPKEYGGANGFQPGSTFKVFTLAAALGQGLPLTTQFDSPSPMTFDMGDFSNCPGEGLFGGDYTATNSTGTGWYNMYSGTRNSVNTFYLQLEELTGVCAPYNLATQMGVRLTDPQAERYPSFTLGIADASPLEMAEAYATFAARGLHCASRPVTQILDSGGNIVKDYAPQCTQVMQQNVADAVSNVLRGVIEGGFASGAGAAGGGRREDRAPPRSRRRCGSAATPPTTPPPPRSPASTHWGDPTPSWGRSSTARPSTTRPAPASRPRSGVTRSSRSRPARRTTTSSTPSASRASARRRRSRRSRRRARRGGNGGGNGNGNGNGNGDGPGR